jgi:hypothetical protein
MAIQVQFRGGTTAEHSTFTGAAKEVTVDTTKKTLVVHDGSTAGGIPVAKAADTVNLTGAQTVAGVKTLSSNPVLDAGTANGVAFLNGSKALTSGSELVFDGTNLGLGVTPSAWGTSGIVLKAFELGGGYGNFVAGATGFPGIFLGANNYFDGSNFRYKTSSGAAYYNVNDGTHNWFTAPSGTAGDAISFTQAMTLDASGNLGVGTTSPAHKIEASSSTNNYIGVTCTVDGNSASRFKNTQRDWLVGVLGSTSGALGFYDITANAERARIDSSGNLLVGKTSGAGSIRLHVSNPTTDYISDFESTHASEPYGPRIRYTAAAPNGTLSWFLTCDDTSALRFQVRSNGGLANYSGNDVNLSDRREKTNFAPAKSYLETICAIPVQTFNYIDQNNEEDPGLTLGVVAQDVQAVAPELVMESNWGTKDEPKMRLSIYQTDLQYALMKALQELKAEFDAYKASHP